MSISIGCFSLLDSSLAKEVCLLTETAPGLGLLGLDDIFRGVIPETSTLYLSIRNIDDLSVLSNLFFKQEEDWKDAESNIEELRAEVLKQNKSRFQGAKYDHALALRSITRRKT